MSLKVGVFIPGPQHSWQPALAFQEQQQLAWYATSVFYDPRRWPYRVERYLPKPLSQSINREFRRRYTRQLDRDLVRQFGIWEWLQIGAQRLNWPRLSDWCNYRGNAAFGYSVIELIQREPPDVVWGFNTAAVEVFRWANKHGVRCVLDQTIGHAKSQNDVMLAERERHPEFFEADYRPFTQERIDQQDEEVALADLVVVGSPFCAQTMIENGCPEEKIRVVPYGFDESSWSETRPDRERLDGRPVRFLFVGQIGPRKGVAYLLKAFARIPESEASLTLLGGLDIPRATFARYADRVTHLRHVPHREVFEHMLAADCFVFPSLFEGGGIVLYEARGAGLGIIQSSACGDGVRDGQNGQCLDTISVDALTDAIQSVLADRDRLIEWQDASWRTREERTWTKYRSKVRGLLNASPS